ncbi:MAG: nSTAND1 domain-containing NTPase, partial [Planctomycetales bacterium]
MSDATPPPEPATPPPAAAASTPPDAKSPGDRLWELLQLAGQFKSWLVSVVAAAVSLWAAIEYGQQLGEWQWVAIAGGAAPMLVAGLCNLLPETLRILRDRRLRRWAVDITEAKPGYFRLWPWTEEDLARFSRPDQAERRIFKWIQSAEQPLLYLTGSSGSGKSSLLNAHVIPELRDAVAGTQFASLVVRSFDDTLADLKKQLLDPQASWHDPELSKKRKLHTLLQAVCESLQSETIPRRLLLVLDQFEELMILHELDDPRFAGVQEFLTGLLEKPIPGLTVLLTLRSDYEHLLEKLGLPRQDRGGTWEKVDPLRATDVRRFLTHSDSGINPQPDVLNAVIEEAQVVDGPRGLVRPIVMNMLGRVLQSRAGETPREFEPGTLLSRYLRESIESSDKSDHLPAILGELVQKDAGTKRPRTVGEVSTQADRDPYLVNGCLRELNDLGLVRPLTHDADVQARTWEVAHDFLARLLVPILETPHRTLWQKTRPTLAPLALVFVLISRLAKSNSVGWAT